MGPNRAETVSVYRRRAPLQRNNCSWNHRCSCTRTGFTKSRNAKLCGKALCLVQVVCSFESSAVLTTPPAPVPRQSRQGTRTKLKRQVAPHARPGVIQRNSACTCVLPGLCAWVLCMLEWPGLHSCQQRHRSGTLRAGTIRLTISRGKERASVKVARAGTGSVMFCTGVPCPQLATCA